MSYDQTAYPYRTVVRITDTIGGQSFQGSGVLISPDEVLTASHVLYDSGVGAATNIVVSPAFGASGAPFGSSTAAYFHYVQIQDANDEITNDQSQYDYAVIHLSQPFSTLGYMGLQADYTGGTANVTGYPGSAAGLQVSAQESVRVDPQYTLLEAASLGPGSSGGPVWIEESNGPYVVGITSSADPGGTGFFTQITDAVFNQIEAWVKQDDAGPNVIDFARQQATVLSDAGGANLVFMNNGNDAFSGVGADTIIGGTGSDTVSAASGNPLAFADTGPFTFNGGSGNSTVIGGSGDLAANGGSGVMIAFGGAGQTVINGGRTSGNILVGGTNNSSVTGYASSDLLVAGSGNATLTAIGSNSTLFGNSGADALVVDSNGVVVIAGTGQQTVEANGQANMFAEAGPDVFVIGNPNAGVADNIVNFKPGVDQILELAGGTVSTVTPTFTNGVFSETLSNGTFLSVYAVG